MTATANTFILGARLNGDNNCNLVTFVILIILLKKFGGPLKEVMDKRERDINKDIDDAEQAKINAQNLKKKIERHLKKLKMKFKKS